MLAFIVTNPRTAQLNFATLRIKKSDSSQKINLKL